MSARLPRLLAVFGTSVALAAAFAACSPSSAAPAPGASTPLAPSAPAQTSPAAPAPSETAGVVDPADVTCENLLPADQVAELTEQGWTFREDPFLIGDTEFPDGISCTWGDFEQEVEDDLLLFGWSPITAEEATTAQTALESEGWIIEQGADGTYVTEDPEGAINRDEDGYGMTYLFGDGWVTVSDTKQGLLLIQRPTS
ncbi:hypothetical protein [Microbacterium sp.]|uniref:hypothetical protein n=1 Tax=Microbacterium sp. TaxID=51671 RepID=UPI0039E466F3